MLRAKPEIYKQLGNQLLFEIALELDDVDVVSTLLAISVDLDSVKDEHGWSLKWLQHVNNPDKRPSGSTPDATGFHFQVPDGWPEPEPSSGFSVSRDGDISTLSFSKESGGRWPERYYSSGSDSYWASGTPKSIRATCPIPPVGSFVLKMEVLDEGSTG